MHTTKAIIFDLYGVMGLNAWQRFKNEHFGDRPAVWQGLQSLGQQVDAGNATNEEFAVAVANAAGVSEAEVRQKFDQTRPNTPLLNWVEKELRGTYKLGLLSNASRDVLHTIFTAGERAMFDAAVTSFHVGLTKPAPAIYSIICKELGVEPTECIMVDDQTRHLETATNLGMKTVLYRSVDQATSEIEKLLPA
ncbi:MAG: HAD-IA family hydrolase [Candidatus Saccharimonadales bacterium]